MDESREVVRQAIDRDLPIMERTLVTAFRGNPFQEWIYADPIDRDLNAGALYRFWLESSLKRSSTFVSPTANSVVITLPPGRHFEPTEVATFGELLESQLGPRFETVLEGFAMLSAARPPGTSYFYMLAWATLPNAQGRGVGRPVFDHALARADQEGVGLHLEVTVPELLGPFEQRGFTIFPALTLPGDGPRIWPAWRPPDHG